MRKTLSILFCFLTLTLFTQAQSNEIQTNGKVCGMPSTSCRDFEAHDLGFRLPAKMTWQKNYYSAFFYAIMLKSRPAVNDQNVDDDNCRNGFYQEAERLRIQSLFPDHKVFASRNGCYVPSVWYTNTNAAYEFIAVYAGQTEAAAKAYLRKVKSRSEFSDASIRRMKVVYGFGD